MPLALVLVLALSRSALAHDRGYSTTELQVSAEGRVDATFTFAASDLERVTAADFLATGVELRADDAPCPGTVDRWNPVGDGLEIGATFRCPQRARAYELTLFLLSDLGPNHRNVARIASRTRTAQAILSPKERALRLEIEPARAPSERGLGLREWVAVSVVAAVVLVLLVRRARSRA